MSERRAAALRLTPDLKMALFTDVVLSFRRKSMGPSPDDGDKFGWYGQTAGARSCFTLIFVDDGILAADITCLDGKSYHLNHVAGHVYRAVETLTPEPLQDESNTFSDDTSQVPDVILRVFEKRAGQLLLKV
jgi:hypothetical protein